MNRLLTVLLCGLVISGLLIVLPAPSTEGAPTRAQPDLRPVVNVPENGGRYQKELGLRVNVTVFNDGDDMGSSMGNLTLVLTNLENGETVSSNFFPIRVVGIESGENRTYQFPNWTGAFAGRFIANATIHYLDDSAPGNNFVEHTFSMWSDYYPGKPELIPKQVSPIRGNTSTLFTFRSEFKYNKIPSWMKMELDDSIVDMIEEDPEDDIPNDGKVFMYETYLPIGNHRYRFIANVSDLADIISPFTNSPWVNISLKNVNVTPKKGYVTTPFHFSVDYGSEQNLPPSTIQLDTGTGTFDLTRSSPNPDYQGGRVEFSTIVQGIDLIPAPLEYHLRCTSGFDSYSIGPFDFEGPRMVLANLTGTVTDLEGTPLPGVVVELDPGGSTRTDAQGEYKITTYIGPRFQISYSKDGFLPRSYPDMEIMEDRNLRIELEEVPVGGSISGYVKSTIGGTVVGLDGATVNISIAGYTNDTTTKEDGYYLMERIPAGSPYILTVSEYRHEVSRITLTIEDGEMTRRNITLTERDMGISMTPDGTEGVIDVDQVFLLQFPMIPDIDTLNMTMTGPGGPKGITLNAIQNSTMVEITPMEPLIFNTHYTIVIGPGADSEEGDLLVWRELSWSFLTDLQPFTAPVSDPEKDSQDIPLDKVIEISFGIALNMSTFSATLNNMDRVSEDISMTVDHENTLNMSDSGRTNTIIRIGHENFTYLTRYSLEVSEILKDVHGRNILDEPLMIEFSTVGEPDSDGDGVVDSEDMFPGDKDEWADTDGDGVGDNSDLFPADGNEWKDLDGDGIGDNEDTDDDGDQMPDSWEIANGLDPTVAGDAFQDKDGDGFTNLEEYLEGTDPQDKGDHPEETGFNTNLVLIGVIAAIIVIIVVVVIMFMLGIIGPKKGEAIDEE